MSALDTLSAGAREQGEFALLRELSSLLEIALEQVEELRDGGLDQWPLSADARGPLCWIAETVEALDALGWQDTIDRLQAERDEKREGEDR